MAGERNSSSIMSFKELFPRFPFKHTRGRCPSTGAKSRKKITAPNGGWKTVLLKYGVPGFCCGFCLFISMWLLHLATYNYVHVMTSWEETYKLRNHHPNSTGLTSGIGSHDLSFGSFNDPFEAILGYQDVSANSMDMIAALFPFCFMVLTVLMDELGSFTRIMMCNGFMALGKGLLGWMTTIPDSIGWEKCKARLGDAGFEYFSGSHTNMEMLQAEVFGINGTHVRWCGDMMWSGHTYFTCIYALGLFELVSILSRDWSPTNRKIVLCSVCAVTVGEQVVEIYCVLASRFHYSMDVFLAVLVSLLFYTNGSISVAAKEWVGGGAHSPGEIHSDGDVHVPPCCFPLCFLYFKNPRQHIFSDAEVRAIAMKCNLDDAGVNDMAENMRISKEYLKDVEMAQGKRQGQERMLEEPLNSRTL